MVGSTCTFSSNMMKTAAYVILFYIRVRISFGTLVHRDAVLNCMPRRLLYMPFPSNWGSDDVSTPSFGMDRNSEIRLESGSAVRMGWLADVFAQPPPTSTLPFDQPCNADKPTATEPCFNRWSCCCTDTLFRRYGYLLSANCGVVALLEGEHEDAAMLLN
jgi:hypothetical protein